MTRPLHTWMALAYLLAAGFPAYQAIRHTDYEMQYLRKINDTNSLQNNGAVKEASFWKEIAAKHHFLGPIIDHFFQPTLDHQFKIPPLKDAQAALDKIPDFNEQQKTEASAALFWSMLLLIISLVYFGLTFFKGDEARSDHIIFPLTIISVVFLVIGILAPAMVIDVSPKVAEFPRFILDYQVRSIFGVISELFASRYWIVAVCLTFFSILIPLAKAGLTVFVLKSGSLSRQLKISNFLHSISKWSMADVFVAAILLSDFAVKSNKNTEADLFLGFYYFLSYCLLSMVVTTLLHKKFRTV
jgi:paraquat-inducible protein A